MEPDVLEEIDSFKNITTLKITRVSYDQAKNRKEFCNCEKGKRYW